MQNKNVTVIISLAFVVIVCLFMIMTVMLLFVSYNEGKDGDSIIPPNPTLTPTPIVISPDQKEIWEILKTPQDNDCEALINSKFELNVYPKINLPDYKEFVSITSVRNLVASDFATDVVDHKGEIVATFYRLNGPALSFSKNGKMAAYYGSTGSDCSGKEFGIVFLDLGVANAPYDIFSEQEIEAASSVPGISWSGDGYVTFYMVGKDQTEMRVVTIELDTKSKIKDLTLIGEQFIAGPCGNVCTPSKVIYDPTNDRYFAGDAINYDIYGTNFILKEYNSFGTLLDQQKFTDTYGKDTDSVIYYEMMNDGSIGIAYSYINPGCEQIEYKDGGTSTFCQNLTTVNPIKPVFLDYYKIN